MTRNHRRVRPKNDGIIDEVAIARTFGGDPQVGARLTPEEREEVLRRAAVRIDEENETIARQRTKVRHTRTVPIGPEDVDLTWKHLLSDGLGYRVTPNARNQYNSLTQAVNRYLERVASAAA